MTKVLKSLLGITLLVGGFILAPVYMPGTSVTVLAAAPLPQRDTYICSWNGEQYYIKGNSLQIIWPNHEAAASFKAVIICVYPDGSHESHQCYFTSKGMTAVSVDNSSLQPVGQGSLAHRIYWTVCDTYIY